MKCFTCSDIPKLEKCQILENDVQSSLCAMCGREIGKVGKMYFKCAKCAFKSCETCRFCAKNHFLKRTIFLGNINNGYGNNQYNCDVCAKSCTADDNGLWHCTACSFDVCRQCLD